MQLKDLGNLINTIDAYKRAGNITSSINKVLSVSFDNLSASEILAKTATMGLTDAQKFQLVNEYATDCANYNTIESLNALSASQEAAARSTTNLRTAFKGLGEQIKTAITAHPYIAVAAAILAIVAVFSKLEDAVIKTNKELKELAETKKKELESAKSQVDSLNSEIETTNKRIDELLSKENLSLVEQGELNKLREQNSLLEAELRLQQQLLDVKNHAYLQAQAAVVNKSFENPRKDNSTSQSLWSLVGLGFVPAITNSYKEIKNGTFDDYISSFGLTTDQRENNIEYLTKQYIKSKEDYENAKKDYDDSLKGDAYLSGRLTQISKEKMDEASESISALQADLMAKYNEYYSYIQAYESSSSQYITSDMTKAYEEAKAQIKELNSLLDLDPGLKTTAIEGIFEKVRFKNVKDELVKLGKNGELSVEKLNSDFGTLIATLDKAGISAEELYQYIMNLANPDGIDFKEVKNQLFKAVGIVDGISNGFEAEVYEALKKAGALTKEGLTAFLDIKANFDTSSWDWEDWLANISKRLSQELSGLTLSEAKQSVASLTEEYESLSEVISNTGNVSIGTYEKLAEKSSRYSSALKVEAGRITVDEKKLKAVNKTRTNAIKTEIKEASTLKKLQWIQEAKKLQQYKFQQNDLTDEIWNTCDSLQEEINQFDILAQGIDAASNAFTNFTEAQDAAESGDYFDIGLDMADAFQKGLESGKIGTPEFLASLEGFMPEDLFAKIINMDDAKAQFQEFQKYYDDVISKFFIRGDDQEYDISGLMNFAEKIASFKDEAGNALYGTFDGTNLILNDMVDYEALADDLKINLDMLYALFGELEEYSFGDSFTFDSENIIDNYYDKLSKVTDAQKLYNEALESGNVNQQAIAQKKLNDALSNYDEMLSGFADKIIHMEDEWAKSDSSMSFGDYLKETYSSDEFELMYSTAIERAEELRAKIQELNERGIGEGNKQWEAYNSELRKLENGISAIENTTAREELLNEAVKSTRERYEELQEIMEQLEDPELDGETIEQLKQKAVELVSVLGQIPESLRIELQSNVDELEAKISSLQDKRAEVVANNKPQLAAGSAGALKQLDSIDSQIAQAKSEKVELEGILNMNTEEAIAKINEVKAQDVDKDSQVHYTADFSGCTDSTPPTLSGVVHYKSVFDNTGAPDNSTSILPKPQKYTGTFNSFATGTPSNVSIRKNEEALVNELGEEGLVRNGKLIPIKGGAQFLKLKRGDIIFNHKQMADLKKHGYTNGRGNMIGNAFANGTVNAYATPYVGTGGVGFFGTKTTKNSTKSNGKKSGKEITDTIEEATEEAKDEAKDATEEIFDYIERRIKRLQAAFDKWLKQAETALTSGFITKYYKKAANAMSQLLNAQGKAYNRYLQEANAVGLDETYAKKVRAGEIDIQTIQDEELADKIAKYQEYYDKAIDSTTSFMETAEKLYNLPLDKAATKIEKFSDAIDLLDKKLDNAIGSKSKNKLVDKQTEEEEKTLEAYKTASKEAAKNYKTAKKTLGKSSTLKNSGVNAKEKKAIQKALKEGKEISLSYFKVGSSGYNAAVKYNEALKANTKATYDLATAQEEYNSWLVEASKIKFDNVADDYEKKVQMLDHQVKAIDNRISEIETAGKKVNRSYYDTQKAINARKLAEYRQEKADLEESLKNIKQGTDEWYEAFDAIQQVSAAISDCVKETYKLNTAINQLHFDSFDDVAESIDRIITEQEFLQGLFAHEKVADGETGGLTEAGIAKLGSLSASYYLSQEKADNYSKLLKELEDVKKYGKQADGKYKFGNWEFDSLDELQDKIDETYTKKQNVLKETYSLGTSLVDVMKEKYQAELDLIKELIDRKKEALQAEKDLHDYQKTITEKTDNIATIQKQIAAYSGDTSQEGLAKLQKLQKELADKQEDLRETEYDRYISDQQDMLDKLYEEYEEQITKKLEDFMGLVQEGLETANNNLSGINDYLSQVADSNGYTEQTKGLFNVATGGIKANTDSIVSAIEKYAEENSGIKSDGQGDVVADSAKPKPVDTNPKENTGNTENKGKSSTESDTDKANKAYDEHLRLQAEENKANAAKQSSDSGSFELVGKSKASTASFDRKEKTPAPVKSGSITEGIFNNLKKLIIPGFKKGGMVSVDDIEKQVQTNGDSVIGSFNQGERILTPVQNEMFEKFIGKLPELNQMADVSQPMIDLPKLPESVPVRNMGDNVTFGDVHYTFELPNVVDEKSFINTMQNSSKVQKCMKSITVDQLSGTGRLSVRSIR